MSSLQGVFFGQYTSRGVISEECSRRVRSMPDAELTRLAALWENRRGTSRVGAGVPAESASLPMDPCSNAAYQEKGARAVDARMHEAGLRGAAAGAGILGASIYLWKGKKWGLVAATLGSIAGYAVGHASKYPQGSW